MKSLAAVRYSKDSPEEFGLEPRAGGAAAHGREVRTSLLSNAVRISPQIFPSLGRAVDLVLDKLQPPMKIEAYVVSDWHANAHCIPLSGDVCAAIVVSSGLVELLREEELPSVLGHELGHYLFGHGCYPAACDTMEDAQRLDVLALRRASEISADRIGFICSPSMDDAFRGMLKVASGLTERHVRFDLTSYLSQLRELKSLSGNNDMIYDTHPMFPLRVRALLWFSMSEPYYYWIDRSGQAPISTEKLNERIEADFAAVSGFGIDHIQSSALRSLKIWCMVTLVSIDHRIGREEQSLLADVLGAEEAQKAIRFVAAHGNDTPALIRRKLDEALEAAKETPEKLRLELIDELERVVSLCGGTDAQRLRVLSEIAGGLGLDRDVEVRPWSFHSFRPSRDPCLKR
jgi:hypothetical protein